MSLKRVFLALVLAASVMGAARARADICTAGACGHWYNAGVDVLIGPSAMTWTNGTSDDCTVFAQDRYVTVMACSEYQLKNPKRSQEMYYFLQALGDDLHIRKSPTIPSCIARRSCWPRPGADFLRLSEPRE